MNANEHLDFYNPDSIYYANSRHYIQQLENKVRQQQAEIEALKMDIHSLTYGERLTKYFNEPVAWMETYKDEPNNLDWDKSNLNYGSEFHDVIPLYTHPAKEITKEDRSKLIGTLKWAEDLLREAGHDEAVSDVQDCLMIIKKAQEK